MPLSGCRSIGLFFIGVPNPLLWGIMATLLRSFPTSVPRCRHWTGGLGHCRRAGLVDAARDHRTVCGGRAHHGATRRALSLWSKHRSVCRSGRRVALFWTWLWGPVGLLLSTPLTVCLVVLGRHVEHLQFLDVLFGNQPALAPAESFYQRILAGDPDEAAYQAEAFLKDRPLAAYYDEVAIKGLALAQQDVRRGVLDHKHRVLIKEAVEGVIDDLSDHQDPWPTASATQRVPAGLAAQMPPDEGGAERAPAVLCVAGRGSLDEAAAAILAQLIRRQGIQAHVVSNYEVSPAQISRLQPTGVQLICLSYLQPDGFAGVRYLVRRLRRELPSAKFMLGA